MTTKQISVVSTLPDDLGVEGKLFSQLIENLPDDQRREAMSLFLHILSRIEVLEKAMEANDAWIYFQLKK